jgi:hypothetical protein
MSRKYQEMILEGSRESVREFIHGYLLGRDLEGEVFYCGDEGIRTEGLGERLKEKLHLQHAHVHVLLEEKLQEPMRKAFDEEQKRGGPRLVKVRPVIGASFRFSFRVFRKDLGMEVRKIVENLPRDVSVSWDDGPEEVLDPSAAGPEGYAPAHDYELHGKGLVLGDASGVIEVHRRAVAHPLLQADEIELEHE